MTNKALFFISAAAVCLLCCTGRAGAKSYPPMAEALAALESDAAVTVERLWIFPWLRPLYVFRPAGGTPQKGFIFYPGAKVDPRSYAPLMHGLAARGHLAAIVPMPFDFAVFGGRRARRVIHRFPDVASWAVGGHSLGGVFACAYARSRAGEALSGVVLWAAYPSSAFSLAGRGLAVLSVYGTSDGLTTVDKIDASVQDLPADAQFVPIQGGNHTQFGYYGSGTELQEGDNPAGISRDEQARQIVEATAAFLDDL